MQKSFDFRRWFNKVLFKEVEMVISELPCLEWWENEVIYVWDCFETLRIYIEGEDDNVVYNDCYFKSKDLF